jgi:hypothetical protein
VATLGALVAPNVVVPKVKLDGEAVNKGRPTPETLTSCGELGALSVIVNAPAKLPIIDGVNVTDIVQELCGAIVWPLQVVSVSERFPLACTPEIVKGALPEFVS